MPGKFDILLQGYLDGKLTPTELEEFLRLVRERDLRLPAAVDQLLEMAEHPPLPAEKETALSTAILRKARRRENRRKSWYWAAAAAIFAAGAAVFYLQPSPRAYVPQEAALDGMHARPAFHQATLVLDDGTAVPLDSAGSRQIGQNVRQANGQLHYAAMSGKEGRPQFNTLVTPKGGRFAITLPDGSKVWLNSASSLRYPTAFTGSSRVVELKGQGYFEVAPHAAQPFFVKVNDMEVQVLGTRFDVMAYEEEKAVSTTLLSGAVRVGKAGASRVLKPGQQALLNEEGMIVQAADTAKAIAWKNGIFMFDNMDLATILREISRWYNVDIVYGVHPSAELYGGAISRDMSLEAVLHMLEENGFNRLKLEGRKITVLP